MLSTIRRLLILSAGALCVGFTVNQIYSEGVRWALLKPQIVNSDDLKQILFISADSAFALYLQGERIFIDTRPEEEYEIDHIPDAISIPLFHYYKSPHILERLDKNTPYILYCFESECREAGVLAAEFGRNGFKNISVMFDGFSAWLEKGYPVE